MISECLPEYLLIASQPSTFTGRGLRASSRGLVGTCVEGWISLIHFTKGENRG
jgi:hypothetical protein